MACCDEVLVSDEVSISLCVKSLIISFYIFFQAQCVFDP